MPASSRLFLTVGFFCFLVPLGLQAQELEGRQKSSLSLAKNLLDGAEREIRKRQESGDTPERVLESLAKKLDKAGEKLADLPPGNAQVQEQNTRHAALLSDLEGLRAAEATKDANAEAEHQAMLDLIQAPEFAQHVQELESLQELFMRASWLDTESWVFRKPHADDDYRVLEKSVKGSPRAIERLAELRQRYAILVDQPRWREMEAIQARILLKDAASYQERWAEAMQAFREKVPARIQEILGQVESSARIAAAEKEFGAFPGIWDNRLQAQRLLKVYQAQTGDPEKTLQDRYQAVTDGLQKAQSSLSAQIIAQNQMPADAYQGADRAQLEKQLRDAWSAQYPQDKILALRFYQPEWKRTKAWDWNPRSQQMELEDYSELNLTVIVKTGDDIATFYQGRLVKDHLSNDHVHARYDGKTDHPGPDRQILVKNVQ